MSGALAESTKGKMMLGKSNKQRIHESTIKALKNARIKKQLTRKQLASRLEVTYKAIEQVENGRNKLSEERLIKYLKALDISHEEFNKIRRGKKLFKEPQSKKVLKLNDRRSYRKIITKEVRVLKTLRRIKEFSQDQASSLCGYSRPTIGHIENGRIAVDNERIVHIITCYGFRIEDFERYQKSESLRDEVIDQCHLKIKELSDEKLAFLKGIIDSMT